MNIHDLLAKYRMPVFAPEDEQGGGEPPAGEPGTSMQEQAPATAQLGGLMARREEAAEGDQGNQDQQESADPTRPEHIPEKFWKDGKLDDEGAMKAYTELERAYGALKRDKTGLGADVPENAGDYFPEGLELGDDVTRLTIDGPDDPGLKSWGEVCHKYGIGKELATNLARDMFGMMDQHAPEQIDPDVEMGKLGKNAKSMIEAVQVWADGAYDAGKLSDADIGVMNQINGTADGVRFLANLRAMMGEAPVPILDETNSRQMTSDSWDRAFKQAVKDKNYDEQERLEKLREEMFPSTRAHGSTGGAVDYTRKL